MSALQAEFECSFDSREDYELYKRLKLERERIKQLNAQKQKQVHDAKLQQEHAKKLQDRERGFNLYMAGANEDRIEEARRRGKEAKAKAHTHRQWQIQTVQLRGTDGEIYRTSPNGVQVVESEDTRHVLEMMEETTRDQLQVLRNSLSHHMASQVAQEMRTSSPSSVASLQPSLTTKAPDTSSPLDSRSEKQQLSCDTALRAPCSTDEILDRITRLDCNKQRVLLRLLDVLEAGGGAVPLDLETSSPRQQRSSASRLNPLEEFGSSSPSSSRGLCPNIMIRLRILSNWGHPRECGLSLLEVLDEATQVLSIPSGSLTLVGAQSGFATLEKVLEGPARSTQTSDMWVAATHATQTGGFEPLELVLELPSSLQPASLRVWNFNCADNLSKGIRDVEVWCLGARVWCGHIPEGIGADHIAPACISLDQGMQETFAEESDDPGSPVKKDKDDWRELLEGIPIRADLDDESPKPLKMDRSCPFGQTMEVRDLRDPFGQTMEDTLLSCGTIEFAATDTWRQNPWEQYSLGAMNKPKLP